MYSRDIGRRPRQELEDFDEGSSGQSRFSAVRGTAMVIKRTRRYHGADAQSVQSGDHEMDMPVIRSRSFRQEPELHQVCSASKFLQEPEINPISTASKYLQEVSDDFPLRMHRHREQEERRSMLQDPEDFGPPVNTLTHKGTHYKVFEHNGTRYYQEVEEEDPFENSRCFMMYSMQKPDEVYKTIRRHLIHPTHYVVLTVTDSDSTEKGTQRNMYNTI